MKKGIAFELLIAVFLIISAWFPMVQLARAPTTVSEPVGVSVGDWWTYDVNFTSFTQQPLMGPYALFNATDWLKCTVLEISGANVTVQQRYHLYNETERAVIGSVDLVRGYANTTSYVFCPYSVISANLTIGDSIFTDVTPYDSYIISQNLSRPYIETLTEVNYVNASVVTNFEFSLYFAKTTGILCELEMNNSEIYTRFLVTQSPVVPEFPSQAFLLLFMIATIATLIVVYGYRKNGQ